MRVVTVLLVATLASTALAAPPAPTGLADLGGDGSVKLVWDPLAAEVAEGYYVYRATASGGPYTLLTSTLITTAAYTDTGLTNGATYYYVVSAEDDAGEEGPQSPELAIVPGSTTVGSTVTTTTTWLAADGPFLIGVVQVKNGGNLTIQAGAEVRAASAGWLQVQSGGAIAVEGTASRPVLMTSDTSSPQAGHWRGLHLSLANASSISNVVVEGTGYQNKAAISVDQMSSIDIVGAEVTARTGIGILINGVPDATVDSAEIEAASATAIQVVYSTAHLSNVIAEADLSTYAIRFLGTANGSIASSSITDSLEVDLSSGIIGLTENTFRDYDDGPPAKLHPDMVGEFFENTVTGTSASSEVKVLGYYLRFVERSATWPSYRYLVSQELKIGSAAGPTLTIEPGARLLMASGSKIVIGQALRPGALVAVGTEASPIEFLGDQATQTAGFWKGLDFDETSSGTNRLEHVRIAGTGKSSSKAIHVLGPDLVLKDALIEKRSGIGVYFGLSQASSVTDVTVEAGPKAAVELSSSTVAMSGMTLAADATHHALRVLGTSGGSLAGSTISHGVELQVPTTVLPVASDNTFLDYDGGLDFILHPDAVGAVFGGDVQGTSGASEVDVVPGSVQAGTISSTGTWPALTYNVSTNVNVAGDVAPELTISPGATIRVSQGKKFQIGDDNDGKLVAVGTAAEPITFTPSNGNSSGWAGLVLAEGTAPTSVLEHVIVELASSGNVQILWSSPTVRSSTIRNGSARGINISGQGAFPRIFDNTISGNGQAGIRTYESADIRGNTITGNATGVEILVAGPRLVVRNNNITGNTVAIKNSDTQDGVDARLNWWGTAQDPRSLLDGTGTVNPWWGGTIDGGFDVFQVAVHPEVFPPEVNSATLEANFSVSADWEVEISDDSSQGVRNFSGSGDSAVFEWFGDDDGGSTLSDGDYTFEMIVEDSATSEVLPTIHGRLSLDSDAPVAKLTAPDADGLVAGEAVPIGGIADAPNSTFQKYQVWLAPGSAPEVSAFEQQVYSSSPATSNQELTTIDTSTLTEGTYTVRLTTTADGGEAEDRVTFRVMSVRHIGLPTRYFSPNDDGVMDVATTGTFESTNGDWALDVLNSSSQVVRSFSGSAGYAEVEWDGLDSTGLLVPDGTYSYELGATDPYTGTESLKTGLAGDTVVDTVAPTVSISSPSEGQDILTYASFDIQGTASDAHLLKYEIYLADASDPDDFNIVSNGFSNVSGGVLGQFPRGEEDNLTRDYGTTPMTNGASTIRLIAADLAGNEATFDRSIDLDRIEITNVTVAPVTLDPFAGETVTVGYTLSHSADVTVEFRQASSGALAATVVNEAARSGSPSEIWDGTSDGTTAVAADAYFLSILATDGTGRITRYNEPSEPSPDIPPPPLITAYYVNDDRSIGQYQLGSVDFSGFRNDEIKIGWDISEAGWVTTTIQLHDVTPYEAFVLETQACPAGPCSTTWDGRRPTGEVYAGPWAWQSVEAPLPLSSIVVVHPDFTLGDARTQPYLFLPIHAQMTHVEYTLPRAAEVEIDLLKPDGNYAATLLPATSQAAGDHVLDWEGRDQGKIVTEEGSYTIVIRATDSLTGATATRRTSVLLYR